MAHIPCRSRAPAWLPAESSDPATIIELMKLGNPELPTSHWKNVMVEKDKNDYRSAIVIIKIGPFAELAKIGDIINNILRAVTLEVYKKVGAANTKAPESLAASSALHDISTEVGCLSNPLYPNLADLDEDLSASMESLCAVSEMSDSGKSDITVVRIN